MSATSICSTTFICVVLTVTVTWSGFGSSSASMWRVSSDSHLARAPSVSGAKEIEPPTWMIMSGTALRTPAISSLNFDRRLRALAVELAHVQVQHRGAGVVAVDRLLDLLFHRHRDVFREVGRDPLGAVGRGGDDQLVLVLGEQGAVEEVHGVPLSEVVGGRAVASRRFSTWLRRRCRRVPSCDGRAGSPSPRSAGSSGCPTSPRCSASSGSAPGTRG